MTKHVHIAESLVDTAEQLDALSKRIRSLASSLTKATKSHGIDTLDINHEQKRRNGIAGLDDWVTDGERKLRNSIMEIEAVN